MTVVPQNEERLVYVAAPYFHDDESVRNYRRRKAIEYSETLFRRGINFYSPLLFSEKFAKNTAREGYWLNHGKMMVKACTEIHVLCLEGWEKSGGIKGEIEVAQEIGIEIKYIERHTRLSFHGSRSLTYEQCEPVLIKEFEESLPEVVVTHGEPAGACNHVRTFCKNNGIPLKLHFLQQYRLKGAFHWRSLVVLEDSEMAIFLHDGVSDGTKNEFELAKKIGKPFRYYRLKDGVLKLDNFIIEDAQDIQLDLLDDLNEKGLDIQTRKGVEYQNFRKAVLERDGKKCVFCGATEKLCVHHIIPFSKSSALSLDTTNGQTLCETCHEGIHGKQRHTKSK